MTTWQFLWDLALVPITLAFIVGLWFGLKGVGFLLWAVTHPKTFWLEYGRDYVWRINKN